MQHTKLMRSVDRTNTYQMHALHKNKLRKKEMIAHDRNK